LREKGRKRQRGCALLGETNHYPGCWWRRKCSSLSIAIGDILCSFFCVFVWWWHDWVILSYPVGWGWFYSIFTAKTYEETVCT
jgi:hypothetical protein